MNNEIEVLLCYENFLLTCNVCVCEMCLSAVE